jgi:hypothetical protein
MSTDAANWTMTRIDVERTYKVADVPDLADTSSRRRRVIRPREVVLHQVHGTNLVRGATVKGRQVRRDGELGGRGHQMILVGTSAKPWGYDAAPPGWLNDILIAEGLEWTSD